MIQIQAHFTISGLFISQPNRKYPVWGLTPDLISSKLILNEEE